VAAPARSTDVLVRGAILGTGTAIMAALTGIDALQTGVQRSWFLVAIFLGLAATGFTITGRQAARRPETPGRPHVE
jgi:hypothetical protein